MIDLPSILKVAVQGGASDVHLKSGLPPLFRINGGLVPLRNGPRLQGEALEQLVAQLCTPEQRAEFATNFEVDFSHALGGLGRFRVNVFRQSGSVGLVMRVIPSEVKSITDLDLPPVLEKIALEPRGLVLVTGATGSGKSTTLAALINHINSTRSANIITVEDPVEYVFRDKRSIINQREIGRDCRSFARALRSALRQDPDVVLVGEMRDAETIETAMTAADTGHLVLSTLHTVDTVETVNRIIGVFPPHQHKQIRTGLASSLKAVVSQRLLKRADGRGRVAAVEVMVCTARIRELLMDEGRILELREAIAQGSTSYEMQTFDQALMQLIKRGLISKDEALDHCTNRDDFLLRLQGVEGTSDSQWEGFEG